MMALFVLSMMTPELCARTEDPPDELSVGGLSVEGAGFLSLSCLTLGTITRSGRVRPPWFSRSRSSSSRTSEKPGLQRENGVRW